MSGTIIVGNSSGTALTLGQCPRGRVENCLIAGNAGDGVAAYNVLAGEIINCTIVDNGGVGLQFGSGYSHLELRNCVLRSNCTSDLDLGFGKPEVAINCCAIDKERIQGSQNVYLLDPIFEDPMFCQPADCGLAPTTTGNYHLHPGSPLLKTISRCGLYIGAYEGGCLGANENTGGFEPPEESHLVSDIFVPQEQDRRVRAEGRIEHVSGTSEEVGPEIVSAPDYDFFQAQVAAFILNSGDGVNGYTRQVSELSPQSLSGSGATVESAFQGGLNWSAYFFAMTKFDVPFQLTEDAPFTLTGELQELDYGATRLSFWNLDGGFLHTFSLDENETLPLDLSGTFPRVTIGWWP